MNAKHTPGPWHDFHADEHGTLPIFAPSWRDHDKGPLARAYIGRAENRDCPPEKISEAVANARLIAAAPDLLAACKAAAAYYECLPKGRDRGHDIPAEFAMLRAAIAKAEGGTA